MDGLGKDIYTPQDDPLGLTVKGRARERRFALAAQGLSSPLGPLPDPNWDGYFEAIAEASKGKPVRFGYEDAPATDLTRDPGAVESQLKGMPMTQSSIPISQQLGTRASLAALRKSLKG